ncbi:hypothetical protein FA15DRAFT_598655 [Coprinopsis marcescibilis]|uniref:Uncharacterized protein n=1 Tax=Coprinopsis marcescibilis TaxID=230819 RepID=A0A5C3KKW0_COPMA|nr:hypothetical protein FA15DRAFT_598655 [Coprinopsis marcescibilis]
MCYRKVLCTRYACKHEIAQADSRVDCGVPTCRYSGSHDTNCQSCTNTCIQWMKPAKKQIEWTSSLLCVHCARKR